LIVFMQWPMRFSSLLLHKRERLVHITHIPTLQPNSLAEHQEWLGTIKQRIVCVRLRMALAASRELILFCTGVQGIPAPGGAPVPFGQQRVDQMQDAVGGNRGGGGQ